jgi:hypothetical protein
MILNLQGDPVETVGLNASTVKFDMENNGTQVATGWGTAGEAYLAYDPTNTWITDDADLVGGFDVMDAMDGNHDGVLNASDSDWAGLRVWVDTTGTGIFNPDDLFTMDQLGISSINLSADHVNASNNGNTILDESTFTFTDGKVGAIAGVGLAFQTSSPVH